MNRNQLGISIIVSAIVALGLLLFGIFVRAGIELPMKDMSYGLVFEMFKKQDFLLFHAQAYGWFFIASLISSILTLKIAGRCHEST